MTGWPLLLILLVTPGAPLILALVLMAQPGARWARALVPWSAVPALATSLLVPVGTGVEAPWIFEGGALGIDYAGRILLFLTSTLWLAAAVAARHWIEARQPRFLVYFLLVMSGNFGLVVSLDMLTFYVAFALMSFASYGLVLHDRSQRARYAGNVYMVLVLAGDMMLFAALVLIAHGSGGEVLFEPARSAVAEAQYADWAVALLILGFGVKVGVLGLHVTLPLIYAAAPPAAGVVLAGAMINAGLLGWLRLLPMGEGSLPAWGGILMAGGAAAAFYGAFVGLLQRRPRAVLGYSSISQMGIITVGVGAGLGATDPAGATMAAVVLYAMHHGFAKGALFYGAGVAERSGARHRLPVMLGLLLPALALSGAPLTSGMLAKETLKEALKVAPPAWQGGLEAALPWMAVATTLVLGRFLWLVWAESGGPRPLDRAPLVAWLALLLLVAAAAWIAAAGGAAHLWRAPVLWEVTWPVLLGAALCGAALLGPIRRRLARLPALPPGDLLAAVTGLTNWLLRGWKQLAHRLLPAARDRALTAVGRLQRPIWSTTAGALERRLVDWRTAGFLFLLTILLYWALLRFA